MAQAAKQEAPIPNVPDDDAVIAVNLSKIRVAQDAASSGHGSLRSVLAHAEGKGVHLKAAKKALSIVRAGDAAAWLEETQLTTRYLRILRHGITENQLKLDFGTTLEPMDERASMDGRAAGLDMVAEESTNPHDLNTAMGQAWITAFRQGRSERDIILSMKDDEAEDEGDEVEEA